jgi:DNA-binding NtrC family response regulator
VAAGSEREKEARLELKDTVILLVEDNQSLAAFTGNHLQEFGAKVHVAGTLADAASIAQRESIDLALLDLHLPDGLSTTLLADLREANPELPVIMVTQRGSVRTAVEAMRLGAVDYLEKPYRQEDLDLAIERALEMDGLRREIRQLRRISQDGRDAPVRGNSEAMRALWQMVETVAPRPSSVLITGENGTGKEVVAQALHAASQRKGQCIPVNCGAIPETLVEDQLFGHEPHAFTDGRTLRRGDFELADQGTLFLDEIGEMPIAMQPKLLRVLEGFGFHRLGGEREIRVDVRVIAATNRNLEEAVAQGSFREDLFFRLNVIPIHVPPLRERREDIPLLIAAFLRDLGRSLKRGRCTLSRTTLRLLVAYDWPGNVRQLRNALERALILAPGAEILPEHLPPEIVGQHQSDQEQPDPDVLWERWLDAAPFTSLALHEAETQLHRHLLQRAMREAGGQTQDAARYLDLSPDSLNYYLKKYGMQDESKRNRATD